MNQVFTSPDGQHAYIDTTNPPQVVGLVPDYWARLVQTLGEMYNTSLSLEWILTASSSSTFAALYDGEIDSACGYWSAQAPWNSSSGLISRAYDFSLMACPTFLQASYVYAPVVSGIDSISSLSAAIDATNGSYPICVTGELLSVYFRVVPQRCTCEHLLIYVVYFAPQMTRLRVRLTGVKVSLGL